MRAITFPKTDADTWANAETGVLVTRTLDNGRVVYMVWAPSTNEAGREFSTYRKTLSQARQAATDTAELVRARVANVYDAAMEENFKRDSRDGAARLAQLDAFFARHDAPPSYGQAAIRRLVDADHAEALLTESYVSVLADRYDRGHEDTIVRINGLIGDPIDKWTADAVRAELQRREDERERAYDGEWLDKFDRDIDEARSQPVLEEGECPRCSGRLASDGVCADDECDDDADDIVHYWPGADSGSTDKRFGELSACGVDIETTPYTFGSPEWDEVTCAACKTKRQNDGEDFEPNALPPVTDGMDVSQLPHRVPGALLGAAKDLYDGKRGLTGGGKSSPFASCHAEALDEYAAERPRDFARHVIVRAQKGNSGVASMDLSRTAFRMPDDQTPTGRTAIEAYIAGETDTLPMTMQPDEVAGRMAAGRMYSRAEYLAATDIPDEALAMNAGFDLAQGQQ